MDISVVIPLYNEEESLPELVAWIKRVVEEHNFSYEIILIDDGSRDKSWKIITELKETYPEHVIGIKFRRNYGKSAALDVGFKKAQGDVVITMDADLQDSPDEIPELYDMIMNQNYDLVSGWKKERKDPLSKTIPTKLFNKTTRLMSGINNLHDFNCGLKAYSNAVVKSVEVYGEMHRYIPVLAKFAGFQRIHEKVVKHYPRKYGSSKFGLNRFVNGFLDLVTVVVTNRYMKKPLHFFGFWGIIFAMIGAGFLSYLAITKLFFDAVLSERTPALIFSAVFLVIGFQSFTTGLLAELFQKYSKSSQNYNIELVLDRE